MHSSFGSRGMAVRLEESGNGQVKLVVLVKDRPRSRMGEDRRGKRNMAMLPVMYYPRY